MIRSIVLAIFGAMLYIGVVQAHETGSMHSHPHPATWERVHIVPTPKAAEMWHKAFDGRVCIVSVNVQGAVHAVLLRGSLLKNDLDGTWHAMEWTAPSMAAAKARRMTLRDMHGNMAIGIETASRDYFHNECGDLPLT